MNREQFQAWVTELQNWSNVLAVEASALSHQAELIRVELEPAEPDGAEGTD